MPVGRGLPTRKSAPGKPKPKASAPSIGSRRRSRGLPLAGGGGASGTTTSVGTSNSNNNAASSNIVRPSSVTSSSSHGASGNVSSNRRNSTSTKTSNKASLPTTSLSTSSKKKKKTPIKTVSNSCINNNSSKSNNKSSNSNINGSNDVALKTEPGLPSLSSQSKSKSKLTTKQTQMKTQLLEAKFDKAGALKINGSRNGSSTWTVRLIVNDKAFCNYHQSDENSSLSIRRNGGGAPFSSSSSSSQDNLKPERQQQQQQQQEQYRPRQHRAFLNGHNAQDASNAPKVKGKDGNFHYCHLCGKVGDVVCCDGCPHVYHPQCLPEDSESFAALDTQHDDDPWYCPDCTRSGMGKMKKKKKKKGSSGSGAGSLIDGVPSKVASNESISPYRQNRPKRKCSYDAGDHLHEDDDELMVDEDGDPVAVAVAEDYGYDEEAEINQGMVSSSSSSLSSLVQKTSPSKSRSGSSKSSGITAKKGASGLLSSVSTTAKKKSKHNSSSNKKQKTPSSGSSSSNNNTRSNSPVRSRSASPTLPTNKTEYSSGDNKKKDKKKKKKKKRKEQDSESTAQAENSGETDAAAQNNHNNKDDDSNSKSNDDDGGMLSHMLNNDSAGLVKAVPAFYFFLNDNRNKIDRNLSRKHRYFNRLPKANMERNQLIAKEGIVMWSKLNEVEVQRYIKISMTDFERRIIEWKEEKTLRSMIAEPDDDDDTGEEEQQEQQQQTGGESDRDLLLEDERLTQENHRRLYLATTVGYKPYKPDLEESNNRILLELLQDTRFHPLPMIQANRLAQEYGEMDFDRITIPYFDVNGPVSTCLGDECLGCARGWTHFCNVLKRRIPAVARRAKLQPPLSSLVATRIGLGLRNPLLTEDNEVDDENGAEKKNGTSSNMNGGIKKSSDKNVETFTSRDIPSAAAAKALPHYPWEALTAPTERADDVVRFVEEAVCMKIPEPPRPGNDEDEDSNGLDENKKTTHPSPPKQTIRLNLPLRKELRRELDDFGGSSVVEDEDNEEITVNKCGRCRTIIEGDTGCVPCRRAQLVINMSRGEGKTDDSEASRLLRIQTNMLGRVVIRDGEVDSQEEGDETVSNHILRQRWTPFAILPPSTLTSPILRANGDSVATNEDDDDYGEENGEESTSAGEDGGANNSIEIDSSMACDAAKAVSDDAISVDPMETEEESSTLTSNNDDEVEVHLPAAKRLRASSRIVALESNGTTSSASASKVSDTSDRHVLTKKFKEEANTLQRKCISIACYGLLLALKRRDPLLHFAEPVVAEGYHDIIQEPMDFGKMKKNVLRNKYATLGTFVSDARLLCDNAMIFNPPDSIYYKTAKELLDVLIVMQKRASEWINTMKDAHAATFSKIFNSIPSNDGKGDKAKNSFLGGDPFRRLRKEWPEAVEMYEDNEWLQKAVETDSIRTKENESAYYGSLAIRRAAMAAAVSLAPYTDSGGIYNTVGRRTHKEDENLRNFIAEKVAESVHPPELKELPSWREEMIMRVLRKSQARRMEGRMGSTHGCARCDGVRVDPESNKAMNAVTVRWGRIRKKPNEVPRIHKSRLGLSTGLGSQNTQARIKRHKASNIRKGLSKGKISALVAAADKVNEVAVTARGSRIHGMGLFADQALQKGDVVAEYVGEYVSPAVTDAREKVYQKERIQDYQFRIDSQLVIDATKQGGHGRYANHNCDPNCVTKIIPFKLDGDSENGGDYITKTSSNGNILKRVVIVALRDIEPMEELTYDYQFPLEVDLNERIPCNCNSELCRGFMNWDLPEKGARNQIFRTQKRGANMRDRIRRLGRPLKGDK